MRAMHVPPLEKVVVETGAHPEACVIWLHGLGADGHDFEPIVPDLFQPGGLHPALSVRFVFPHAPAMPVTLNGGYIMPAWYDFWQTPDGRIAHDEASIRRSARQIQMLIEQQVMHGIAPRRIMLAGFSQGAAMALHCGLRQEEGLAGIVALSGYLLLPERLEAEMTPAGRATPVFMAHGTEDAVVPFVAGVHARETLTAAGCRVAWHEYPIAHQVCEPEIAAIGRFMAEHLA